jgi:PAS domain S-box-containing protein
MDTTLRVLIIEDSESDAGLILRHLERAGYVPFHERVETAAAMKAAMQRQEWDIVFADYNMPEFDALAALRLVQESGPDIPFIVVSASIGEDTAVAMMKAGAHDYVVKSNLARLIPAVQRELGDAEVRRRRRLAEEALQRSEERYRVLYEDNPSMYFTTDAEGTVLSVNRFGAEELGYSAEELVGRPVLTVFHPDDREAVREQFTLCVQNPMQTFHWEFRKIRKDGSVLWVKETARAVQNPRGNPVVLVVCEDITERKQAEDALKKRENDLKDKTRNLEELNTALKVLLKQRGRDREEFEEWVLANVENLIMPYIDELRKLSLEPRAATYISILESNLKDITSSFSRRLSAKYVNLTSKELEIANLIKGGKTSKDIAGLLNVSERTVDFHRKNIRRKLGLYNRKENLRSHLLAMS